MSTEKKVPLLETVLAILSALALFTPVFSGYMIGFFIICLWFFGLKKQDSTNDSFKTASFCRLLAPIDGARKTFLLALFFITLVSTLLHSYRWSAALGGFGHFLVKFGLLWVLYRYFWEHSFKNQRMLTSFTWVFACASFLHLIYCLVQRHWGIDLGRGTLTYLPSNRLSYGVYRISGFMGHPLSLGYSLAFSSLAALSFAFTLPSKRDRKLWGLAACSNLSVLFLSGSRGPMLSGIVGIIVFFFLRAKRKNLSALIISGSLFVALVLSYQLGLQERFTELTRQNGDGRLIHWSVFSQIFFDYPLWGIGPGASKEAISSYYLKAGADDNIRLAHNAFLQFAAVFGVFGLLFAMRWVGSWIRFARRLETLKASGWAFFAMIVTGSMTQNTLQDSQVIYSLTVWTLLLAVHEVNISETSGGWRKREDIFARESGEDS